MLSSFCLSHCYACPVFSPGYYKSLNAIVVSRATDPSIPVVIMCEITLSLAFSLLFPEEGGKKKKQHRFTKSSFYVIVFSLLTPNYFISVKSSHSLVSRAFV